MQVEKTIDQPTPRNQSDTHFELSARSLRWLGARSTRRGVLGNTEVFLEPQYVADALGICGLQDRYFGRYLHFSGLCAKHIRSDGHGNPIVCGDVDNELACVFEVKVSRSDFLSTFRRGSRRENRLRPVGSLHWCVTPRNLVSPDELPDFWGLLESSGSGLREVRLPVLHILPDPQLYLLAYRLLKCQYRPQSAMRIPTCPSCGSDYE